MNRITKIADLHNASITDTARLPHPCLLARWSERGLYRIDADAGRFIVAGHDQPRIATGAHAGRIDLNALRARA